MPKRLRIYIAGPYTAEDQAASEANTHKAIDAGIAVLRKGHIPFIPHLTHYVDRRAREVGIELTWQDYVDWDLQWLKVSDGILYLGQSKGADIELQEARTLGKKIFFTLEEIPDAFDVHRIRPNVFVERK